MENVTQNPEDIEITVTRGDLRLIVSPYGASLRGLARKAGDGQYQDIITGYQGAAGKVGGQGDVLIPFPGRIAHGRYTFGGQTYQMEENDKEGPSAIHGFLRHTIWESAVQDTRVTFSTNINTDEYPGYPFSLEVQVAYLLTEEGLTNEFSIKNIGDAPAPVAAGFHPYFTTGPSFIDADNLHVPFSSFLEFDGDLLPTGQVLSVENTPYDFRIPHAIGDVPLNTCYLNPERDPDGLLRIRLSDAAGSRAVTVWQDKAFDYVVLYSGDPLPDSHRRRSLAIEPMTCASDAFNHPEWGLVSLQPGQALTGAWGVTAE